jgi:hypothetical protein
MGTITVTLRHWDKGLYWSDDHLSIFPILSRNLMGFDDR